MSSAERTIELLERVIRQNNNLLAMAAHIENPADRAEVLKRIEIHIDDTKSILNRRLMPAP